HLQRDLGAPIPVEVPGDLRCPPDTHRHVPTEVVPPHELAGAAVVRLELEGIRAVADRPRIQSMTGSRLLDDVVEDAIAVEVADSDPVEEVVALQRDRPHLVWR